MIDNRPIIANALTAVLREDYGRLIAILMGHSHELDLAEDALQDASAQALLSWAKEGLPKNPSAWLLTVARRRLIDRFRKDSRHDSEAAIRDITSALYESQAESEADQDIPDERLKLMFTCCHPSLAEEARVALTLKTLCGLNARQIARAFLVSETTMNQRLSRAKQKIKRAGIAYQVPDAQHLCERLHSVLASIYLVYNESYSAYESQELTRSDFAQEAIRLAQLLFRLIPEPEAAGLLALLQFHDSRRGARSSGSQSYIPLAQQQRQLWDREQISQGRKVLLTAMAQGKPGPYQIQAAISALHAEAEDWQSTDWLQIVLLYDKLYQLAPSPVVLLNQAVALGNWGKLNEALNRLLNIEAALAGYQPFHAAKADVHRQLGQNELARQSYQQAINLSKNGAERDYLIKCRNELT